MKFLDLIHNLAAKCGKQNEQAIIDLLSRADLQNIDIADDVANAMNNSLLTIESAKNNPLLKSHFTATALAGMDTELLSMASALGLEENFIAELTGEKNTYSKPGKVAEKLKAVIEGLKTAQTKGESKDIEKYVNQINSLNAQLSKAKESSVPKEELDRIKNEYANELLNYSITHSLSDVNFANTSVPKNVNILTAKMLIEEALKGKAVVVREDGELKLKRADDTALNYFDESNKAISYDDFAKKVLADNNLLAVSGGNPPKTVSSGGTFIQPTEGVNTSKFDAAVTASIEDTK